MESIIGTTYKKDSETATYIHLNDVPLLVHHWCGETDDGRPGVDQLWVTPPARIEREICRQALEKGLWWHGCHWDHPCIVETDTSRLDAWEEMNPGR